MANRPLLAKRPEGARPLAGGRDRGDRRCEADQEETLLSSAAAVPGLCAELAPHVYAILDSFMGRTRCTARRASVMRSWSLAAELESGFAVAGAAFVRRHDVFALITSAELRLFMQDRV